MQVKNQKQKQTSKKKKTHKKIKEDSWQDGRPFSWNKGSLGPERLHGVV